ETGFGRGPGEVGGTSREDRNPGKAVVGGGEIFGKPSGSVLGEGSEEVVPRRKPADADVGGHFRFSRVVFRAVVAAAAQVEASRWKPWRASFEAQFSLAIMAVACLCSKNTAISSRVSNLYFMG